MGGQMTAEEALGRFLSKALQKRWRDRYATLLRTKRGRGELINSLPHAFEQRWDPAKAVEGLAEDIWAAPAFSFSFYSGFGRGEKSMRDAFDTVGACSLIIDRTGTHGIYHPEDIVDDIMFFRV